MDRPRNGENEKAREREKERETESVRSQPPTLFEFYDWFRISVYTLKDTKDLWIF